MGMYSPVHHHASVIGFRGQLHGPKALKLVEYVEMPTLGDAPVLRRPHGCIVYLKKRKIPLRDLKDSSTGQT